MFCNFCVLEFKDFRASSWNDIPYLPPVWYYIEHKWYYRQLFGPVDDPPDHHDIICKGRIYYSMAPKQNEYLRKNMKKMHML